MTLAINLNKPILRVAFMVLAFVLGGGLMRLVYVRFVVSVLTAKNTPVSVEALTTMATSLPHSARLQARLADALLSQGAPDSQLLAQADAAATRAVNLTPLNANYHILFAAAKSMAGETEVSELHLRTAVTLAPHNAQIRWRLANALLRVGKTENALDEFRLAVTASPALLSTTLDLLWQMTDENVAALVRATGETTKNRLQLAQFLLKQTRFDEAMRIVSSIDRAERLAAPEVTGVLNELLTAGKLELAHQLWLELMTTPGSHPLLLWNGSFEEASPANLSQFEWQLRSNGYVQLALDPYVAHSGTKSLRLDFFGRDTTRLSNEIKQLIVVRPGGRYRLTCFVKTAKLLTPEGPRIVVTTPDAAQTLAASRPINAEAADWQQFTIEFTALTKTAGLLISVQRIPRAGYDDPTQGTIWFDDFALTELH